MKTDLSIPSSEARITAHGPAGRRQRQRGFTLLEMIGVLILIVAAGAGIWQGIGYARSLMTANDAKDLLARTVQEINRAYQNQTNVEAGADLTTLLIQRDVIPTGLIQGSSVSSPFGGSYSVDGPSSPAARFTVTFGSLSEAQCIEVLGWNFEAIGPLQGISFRGSNLSLPVTPTQASSTCASAPGDLQLTFRKS